MNRILLVTVIFTFTSLCSAQSTCSEDVRTPGRAYPANFPSFKPLVEVRLNDSRPLHFILDTGSPLAGIDSSLVETLGFRPEAVLSRSGGAGESGAVIMRLLPKACEEMGGATLANGSVISLDLSHVSRAEGVRVDGILGGDFYRRYIVVVDYEHRAVQLYDRSFDYHGDGLLLPIEVDGNHMFTSARLRSATGEYIEGRFMIDTGVRVALLLNAPFSQKTNIVRGYKTIPKITYGIGAGGETRGQMFKIKELQLGSLRLADVIAFASSDTKGVLANAGFAGIIGADLLRRYKLFLDYPHSRIVLEKTAASETSFNYDQSGMFLIADGAGLDQIRIFRVLPGSPADEAGVRDDDVLVSIDGKDATALGLDQVRQMLQMSRRYSLQIRRGDKPLTLTITTRDLLSTPAAIPSGTG